MGKKNSIRIDKYTSVPSDTGCWWADTVMLKFWGKAQSHCLECPFQRCIKELTGRAVRKYLVDEIARIEKEQVNGASGEVSK